MLAKEEAWQTLGCDPATGEAIPGAVSACPDGELRLVAKLLTGDDESFTTLVKTYQPMLFSVVLRIVKDPEEARDLSQETFLRVYRNLQGFRGECSLKTWILKIGINQALKSQRWWKRRGRRETCSLDTSDDERSLTEVLASGDATPEAACLATEMEGRIETALSRLKPDYRVVIVLREMQGLSYEEIASVVCISLGTVKSRLARAREMLREAVKDIISER